MGEARNSAGWGRAWSRSQRPSVSSESGPWRRAPVKFPQGKGPSRRRQYRPRQIRSSRRRQCIGIWGAGKDED